MAEHCASVMVQAPVHQVYELFTHFNDFPKFMRFVKEVTYHDDQRSHWVVQVLGRHEWDAVNEDWVTDQQVGWRSTNGLKNTGKVKFRALAANRTQVDVYICYSPPSGALGAIGENLGIDNYFDSLLQEEMNNFARMVEEAPPGALDPMSSHYLFHSHSAAARGDVTPRQSEAMARDPMMSQQALAERQMRIVQEQEMRRHGEMEREAELQRLAAMEREQAAALELQFRLEQEAARRRTERKAREALLAAPDTNVIRDPVYHTIGGRNASIERTAFGDKDAIRPRHHKYEQDPMSSRLPVKKQGTADATGDAKLESPWYLSIRGPNTGELPDISQT